MGTRISLLEGISRTRKSAWWSGSSTWFKGERLNPSGTRIVVSHGLLGPSCCTAVGYSVVCEWNYRAKPLFYDVIGGKLFYPRPYYPAECVWKWKCTENPENLDICSDSGRGAGRRTNELKTLYKWRFIVKRKQKKWTEAPWLPWLQLP